MNEVDRASDEPGNRLAKLVATGLASVIGIAIVAVGGTVISNSSAIADLRARCVATKDSIFELHSTLSGYPSATDLMGCSGRLQALEHYKAIDDHRMGKLEKTVEDLQHNASARPDPFTGTEGRELDRRIKELERRP